jgi:hypothetical protein
LPLPRSPRPDRRKEPAPETLTDSVAQEASILCCLAAIDRGAETTGTATSEEVRPLLHALTQAQAQRLPALGLGESVRLSGCWGLREGAGNHQ